MITNTTTQQPLTTHTTHHTRTKRCRVLVEGGKIGVGCRTTDLPTLQKAHTSPPVGWGDQERPVGDQPKAIRKVWKTLYKNYPWGPRPMKCPNCATHGLKATHDNSEVWCYTCGYRREF